MPDASGDLGYTIRAKQPLKKLDRVKEFLNDKAGYLKDSIESNKRQTVYVVATIGSGITGYALTGQPLAGVAWTTIACSASLIHDELHKKVNRD